MNFFSRILYSFKILKHVRKKNYSMIISRSIIPSLILAIFNIKNTLEIHSEMTSITHIFFIYTFTHFSPACPKQERYELVVSNAVAMLASRKWFSNDESYEAFCLETVVPCFTALAIAVGRDTLWKPMNHAILMLTRDKKKVVRVVCVKALHKLFSVVGVALHILLPESLPFLSELLEDSNPAVSAATAALVRYIEDVSGESMDTYLQ